MTTIIHHRYTDARLYESESAPTLRAAVVEAVAGGADLRGADLGGADLRGAALGGADLRDAKGLPEEVPVVQNLDAAILAAIERPGCGLDMKTWHTCKTTHCRAGWAITLAGEAGAALERRVGAAAAGALIYARSTERPVPDFYASTEDTLADLRAFATGGAEGAPKGDGP